MSTERGVVWDIPMKPRYVSLSAVELVRAVGDGIWIIGEFKVFYSLFHTERAVQFSEQFFAGYRVFIP